MDKFMCYVPFWFKAARNRYFRWDGEMMWSGIVLCVILHSQIQIVGQCTIQRHTINKAIIIFIKYGVKLFLTMKLCKKICNECPFSQESMPGWLGPHDIDEILNAQQFETPFSCHKQRTDDTKLEDIITGEIDICRGFVASASKSCKSFGQNPMFGSALKNLQDEITTEDKELVLTRWDFRKHHEQ